MYHRTEIHPELSVGHEAAQCEPGIDGVPCCAQQESNVYIYIYLYLFIVYSIYIERERGSKSTGLL